jgi:uncharacterized membrane protein YebE (DUF533 family)
MGVTQSEFQMWRAVFALAHADGKVTDTEVRFMAEALEDISFSPEQKTVLMDDIKNPKNIFEMFKDIKNPKDQTRFFEFAHDIVWVDGDFGKEEQAIMLELQKIQLHQVNVDHLVGNVELELDDDRPRATQNPEYNGNKKKKIVYLFRDKFLQEKVKLKDDLKTKS